MFELEMMLLKAELATRRQDSRCLQEARVRGRNCRFAVVVSEAMLARFVVMFSALERLDCGAQRPVMTVTASRAASESVFRSGDHMGAEEVMNAEASR